MRPFARLFKLRVLPPTSLIRAKKRQMKLDEVASGTSHRASRV